MAIRTDRSAVESRRRAVEALEKSRDQNLAGELRGAEKKRPNAFSRGDVFEHGTSRPASLTTSHGPRSLHASAGTELSSTLGLSSSSSSSEPKRGLVDTGEVRELATTHGRAGLEDRLNAAKERERAAAQQLGEAEGRLSSAREERDAAKARYDDALQNGSENRILAMEQRLGEAEVEVSRAEAEVADARSRLDDARREREAIEQQIGSGGDPASEPPSAPPSEPPNVDPNHGDDPAYTAPPPSTGSAALQTLLDENPSLQTNQDLINHFYSSSDDTWAGAAGQAERYGLDLNQLVENRDGDVRALPGAVAPPSAPPDAPYELPDDGNPGGGGSPDPVVPSPDPIDTTPPTVVTAPGDGLPEDPVNPAPVDNAAATSSFQAAFDALDDIEDKDARRQATLGALNGLEQALATRTPYQAEKLLRDIGPAALEQLGRRLPELKEGQTKQAVDALTRVGEHLGDAHVDTLTNGLARGLNEGLRQDGYHDDQNAHELESSLESAIAEGRGTSFAASLAEATNRHTEGPLAVASQRALATGVQKLATRLDDATAKDQQRRAEIADFNARTSGLLDDDQSARGTAAFEEERQTLMAERTAAAANLAEAAAALEHTGFESTGAFLAARSAGDALANAAGTEAGDAYLAGLMARPEGFAKLAGAATDKDALGAAAAQGAASVGGRTSDEVRDLLTAALGEAGTAGARTKSALDTYAAIESGDYGALGFESLAQGEDIAKLFGKEGLAAALGKGTHVVGAVFDAKGAVDALAAGDKTRAALHLAGVASTGLALAGVGGPAGAVLGAISGLGLVGLDLYRAHKEEQRVRSDYESFLEAAVGPTAREAFGPLLDYESAGGVSEAFAEAERRYGVPDEEIARRAMMLDDVAQEVLASYGASGVSVDRVLAKMIAMGLVDPSRGGAVNE